MFLPRALLVATVVAATAVSGSAATAKEHDGKLSGLFTFSARGHTSAIWGVVTLVNPAAKVHRIEVDRQGDPHLKAGRFSQELTPGKYRVSCQSKRFGNCRDGGGCGAYLTGHRFHISHPFRPVTALTIKAAKTTYVRINCFGHG